jgi:DNA modification methylase
MLNTPSAPAASDQLGPWRLNQTHNVDCLTGLKAMPDDCIDMFVTSPPYWGQRGNDGLGLEPDPRDYVKNLVEVLDEAMRCLKPSGVFWLNVGDAYNTPINWREEDYVHSSLGAEGKGLDKNNSAYTKVRGRRKACIDKTVGFLQYGNLLAIPYRIVTAMGDKGWLFRGEVVWVKSRPLPEGICRRPHRRHEGIYIFAKDERHTFRVKPPVGSVWELKQIPNKLPHCSTFPLDLPYECALASDLKTGAVICDPFMGSGTTARAAQMLGLFHLGFELDEAMCGLANEQGRESAQPMLNLG